jgi:hypothetical protein
MGCESGSKCGPLPVRRMSANWDEAFMLMRNDLSFEKKARPVKDVQIYHFTVGDALSSMNHGGSLKFAINVSQDPISSRIH